MYILKYLTVLVVITVHYVLCDEATDSGNESFTSIPDLNEIVSWETTTEIEKVKVEVYYESLCRFCKNFFINELAPEIPSMHQYLDIKLFPFGNAFITEEDGHYNFTCQHGEPECYGNKLHACAIDILKNVTKSTLFNSCLFEFRSNDEAVDKCAIRMKSNGETIKECAKSEKGDELLKYYGDESQKIYYHGVPHVLLNGELSLNVFKEDVCEAFKNPPPPCRTITTTTIATTDE